MRSQTDWPLIPSRNVNPLYSVYSSSWGQRRITHSCARGKLNSVFLSPIYTTELPLLCDQPTAGLLPTHLPPPHEVCDSPDQAAHCHTLGPKQESSSLHFMKRNCDHKFYCIFISAGQVCIMVTPYTRGSQSVVRGLPVVPELYSGGPRNN
jgi:hypothetical protein